MKTIYFITHPDVIIDQSKPPSEWHISEKGENQVTQLASQHFWRYVQHIFTSSEPRATETGQILHSIHNIAIRPFPELQEQRRSNTNYFLSLTELAITMRMFFSRPKESIRGWESAVDAQKRMVNAIDSLQELYPDYQTIAIISHGIVGSLLRGYLMNHPIEESLCQEDIGSYIQFDWEHKCVVSDDWIPY